MEINLLDFLSENEISNLETLTEGKIEAFLTGKGFTKDILMQRPIDGVLPFHSSLYLSQAVVLERGKKFEVRASCELWEPDLPHNGSTTKKSYGFKCTITKDTDNSYSISDFRSE